MSSSDNDSAAPRRYSWLGTDDLVRERLVESEGVGGREPSIRCAGEFDASSSDELEAALMELAGTEIDRLALDLERVEFLDGYVLGLLTALQLRLARREVELRITARGQPRRMLELSGLAASVELAPKPATSRRVG